MVELSLNQATTRPYSLGETAEVLSQKGVRHIGLWLEPVAQLGVEETRRILGATGLRPTSMCRTGFVADKSGQALRRAMDDVRRAIELSGQLAVPQLTFIAGGLPDGSRNINAAESTVRRCLEELVPEAEQAGVRLALEPLHPLFMDERSIVTTIGQGLRIIRDLPSSAVGLLIDSYATYWDSELHWSIAEAKGRIAGYQVNDFALPLPAPHHMNGRLLPGEGWIDLPAITRSVRAAGYRDPIEVEVFSEELWGQPLQEIVERTVQAFDQAVRIPTQKLEEQE